MNDVPGARQSRDPACAAAQVDPLQVHQNEKYPSGYFLFCIYTCENYTLLRKLDLNLELRLRSLTEWPLRKGKEL